MKSMTFLFNSSPNDSDRSYQVIRMALSVAMDVHVTVVYRGDAAVMAMAKRSKSKDLMDFMSQEKYLMEMEIPIFVSSNDINRDGISSTQIRSYITVLPEEEMVRKVMESDIVFNA